MRVERAPDQPEEKNKNKKKGETSSRKNEERKPACAPPRAGRARSGEEEMGETKETKGVWWREERARADAGRSTAFQRPLWVFATTVGPGSPRAEQPGERECLRCASGNSA